MKSEYDLLSHLPCITAEMAGAYQRLRRASVVYLCDPERDFAEDEVECYGFDFGGNPAQAFVPWHRLRHIKIRRVRTFIGKYCKRMSEDGMNEMLARIRQTRVKPLDDFSTGLEDWE